MDKISLAEQNSEKRKRTVTRKVRDIWNTRNGYIKMEKYMYMTSLPAEILDVAIFLEKYVTYFAL